MAVTASWIYLFLDVEVANKPANYRLAVNFHRHYSLLARRISKRSNECGEKFCKCWKNERLLVTVAAANLNGYEEQNQICLDEILSLVRTIIPDNKLRLNTWRSKRKAFQSRNSSYEDISLTITAKWVSFTEVPLEHRRKQPETISNFLSINRITYGNISDANHVAFIPDPTTFIIPCRNAN